MNTPTPAPTPTTDNNTLAQPRAATPLTPKTGGRNWLALAGAGGASLVAAGSAGAATVQIDLIGNQITTAGNSLNADLTGDGSGDVLLVAGVSVSGFPSAYVYISGALAWAWHLNIVDHPSAYGVLLDSPRVDEPTPQQLRGLRPVTLTDNSINGGASTNAFLEVHVFNTSPSLHSVVFTRLVFDDASTTAPTGVIAGGSNTSIGQSENGVFTPASVPEPSRLALLALGAGGILLRRQRKMKTVAA